MDTYATFRTSFSALVFLKLHWTSRAFETNSRVRESGRATYAVGETGTLAQSCASHAPTSDPRRAGAGGAERARRAELRRARTAASAAASWSKRRRLSGPARSLTRSTTQSTSQRRTPCSVRAGRRREGLSWRSSAQGRHTRAVWWRSVAASGARTLVHVVSAHVSKSLSHKHREATRIDCPLLSPTVAWHTSL